MAPRLAFELLCPAAYDRAPRHPSSASRCSRDHDRIQRLRATALDVVLAAAALLVAESRRRDPALGATRRQRLRARDCFGARWAARDRQDAPHTARPAGA